MFAHATGDEDVPNPNDLAKVRDVAALVGLQPYLEQDIMSIEKALETRIYRDLNAGTLTPEAAFAAWQEKAVLRRLLQRFRGRIEGGKSIGEALGVAIDLENLPH